MSNLVVLLVEDLPQLETPPPKRASPAAARVISRHLGLVSAGFHVSLEFTMCPLFRNSVRPERWGVLPGTPRGTRQRQ